MNSAALDSVAVEVGPGSYERQRANEQGTPLDGAT